MKHLEQCLEPVGSTGLNSKFTVGKDGFVS